jgi:hypothetical protein
MLIIAAEKLYFGGTCTIGKGELAADKYHVHLYFFAPFASIYGLS